MNEFFIPGVGYRSGAFKDTKGCWDVYYSLKPDVIAGKDFFFTPPKAPHTFLEIMAVVRG